MDFYTSGWANIDERFVKQRLRLALLTEHLTDEVERNL